MDTNAQTPVRLPARVAVVGPGRLGTRPGRARCAPPGVDVDGPAGPRRAPPPAPTPCSSACPTPRSRPPPRPSPASRPLVGHTSGATPLAALDPPAPQAFGLHPLQTFAGGEGPERFAGAGCAVAGSTPAALDAARGLARGARHARRSRSTTPAAPPTTPPPRSPPTSWSPSRPPPSSVAAGAGLEPGRGPRAARAARAQHGRELGRAAAPSAALTGPVARGDDATVARQRDAVAEAAPELLALFDALVERTRALAGRGVPA